MTGHGNTAGLRHQWRRDPHGQHHDRREQQPVRRDNAPVDLKALHDMAVARPRDVFAWKILADALMNAGQDAAAEAAWQTAAQRNPKDINFAAHKAEFHFMRGDDQATLATLNPVMMRLADTSVPVDRLNGFQRGHTLRAIALLQIVAGENNGLFKRVYENCMRHETYLEVCDIVSALHADPRRIAVEAAQTKQAARDARGFRRPEWGTPLGTPIHG